MNTRRTGALFALLPVAVPDRAWAHSGTHLAPHDLWSAWSFDPGVLGGLALAGLVYVSGLRRLWARAGAGRGVARWRPYCFAAGLGVLGAALVSPLHALGTALFSGHMTQHLLLMVPAPLLLVLGAPLLPALHALPQGMHRPLSTVWRRARALRAAFAFLALAPVTWLLNTVVLWIWHAPPLFEAALRSGRIHALEHASFLAASVLLWAVVFPSRPVRVRQGTGVLLIVTTAMQGGLLAAILTFAETPWYGSYEATAHAWGLTALEDQQLAGAIMWVPSSIAYLVAATVLFLLWLGGRTGHPARLTVPPAPPAPARTGGAVATQVLVLMLLAGALAACGDRAGASARVAVPDGDPGQGRRLIRAYGCGNCHTIPGVRGARGTVGPPLTAFARRDLIAGKFRNSPDRLVAWIMNAPALDPGVAMPDLGVTESQARHISAYLYQLR